LPGGRDERARQSGRDDARPRDRDHPHPRCAARVACAEEHRTTLRDAAVEAHPRAEIRRLIADGCVAALPAGTVGRLRARADKGPTRTIASLVADVR